ncbi:MAG TPA: DUF2269 family protein [Steroidobacteraceae bacterium]|nr:DUF2269 family protein [Steroidobacteraceae bacterium]
MTYLGLKYAHILIAIVSVGTNAALVVLLEFFAADPDHGAFMLGTVRRLLHFVVMPGYVLMLITGMWMGHMASLLDEHWAESAMNLWGVGFLFFVASSFVLKRQIRLFAEQGPASAAYRRVAVFGRFCALGSGVVIVTILTFMVFK